MHRILMSIKPEFVKKILSGEKEFEFRKVCCNDNVKKLIIYSTNPVKKVVGEANIVDIVKGTPFSVWEKTRHKSGITKDFFDKYYDGHKKAVAYKLANVRCYDKPKKLRDFGISVAPQSFVYLDK